MRLFGAIGILLGSAVGWFFWHDSLTVTITVHLLVGYGCGLLMAHLADHWPRVNR